MAASANPTMRAAVGAVEGVVGAVELCRAVDVEDGDALARRGSEEGMLGSVCICSHSCGV